MYDMNYEFLIGRGTYSALQPKGNFFRTFGSFTFSSTECSYHRALHDVCGWIFNEFPGGWENGNFNLEKSCCMMQGPLLGDEHKEAGSSIFPVSHDMLERPLENLRFRITQYDTKDHMIDGTQPFSRAVWALFL